MADRVNSLLADLKRCAVDMLCIACGHRIGGDGGSLVCGDRLMIDAADVLQEYVDRSKRYADEVMALRERQRWIPVAERLPEDRSNVLVVAYWHEKWGVYMGWCAPERAEWCVHIGIGDRSDVAVTHWMPLPTAPEVTCDG